MEIDGNKRGFRSAKEIAMERADAMIAKSGVRHDSPRIDRGANGPIVDMRDDEHTYNEDMFVKNDHVSVVDNNLSRGKQRNSPSVSSPEDLNRDEQTLIDMTAMPALPEPEAKNYEVACHWGGPMFDYGGYARMNRTFIIGLFRRGALIRTRPLESITNVNAATEDFLRKLSVAKIPDKCPRVYGQTIPDVMAHGGRKILYTMMETSNGIHPELAERYNLADEIWVPCTWNVETFRASGVIPEIRVMPLGVDTKMFSPDVEPLDFKFGTRSFRFLSVFGWSFRKGYDVLIQAFLEEFSSKDDVSLVISSRFVGDKDKKKRIFSDFSHIRAMVSKEDHELPHVALHCEYTPDKDMPKLYRSGHCFVLPSRGEGFGLPYCEAGACGIPVIASDHGGQRDFLDDEVAYLVPPDGYYTCRPEDQTYRAMSWISHFYENQDFPHYGRTAIETLKAHMRDVYENYSRAQEKAVKLRDRLVNNFDWSHSIGKVYGRLKEICDEL